jgi:hypothetical protein
MEKYEEEEDAFITALFFAAASSSASHPGKINQGVKSPSKKGRPFAEKRERSWKDRIFPLFLARRIRLKCCCFCCGRQK